MASLEAIALALARSQRRGTDLRRRMVWKVRAGAVSLRKRTDLKPVCARQWGGVVEVEQGPVGSNHASRTSGDQEFSVAGH